MKNFPEWIKKLPMFQKTERRIEYVIVPQYDRDWKGGERGRVYQLFSCAHDVEGKAPSIWNWVGESIYEDEVLEMKRLLET